MSTISIWLSISYYSSMESQSSVFSKNFGIAFTPDRGATERSATPERNSCLAMQKTGLLPLVVNSGLLPIPV
jgi:hypothetical protein